MQPQARRDVENEPAIQAVVFDMDGVMTNTMEAHFAAWKQVFDEALRARSEKGGEPFRPFTKDEYFAHVDGIPRFDGVRRFFESRSIALPEGAEDDQTLETIHGIGNRKNQVFRDWLAKETVPAYPDAVSFVQTLKDHGIKVGIFSASRNSQDVLKSAHIADLFDAHVDGTDARELGLPGKPDPAMLIETARRLGADPAHCAVVEDAVSGVGAGATGHFRLVIGVTREPEGSDAHAKALRRSGADIVTHDLAALLREGSPARQRLL
ncbi:beta-phosphoglucomutase family hydrolase [Methyloligella sp. 2.7D]|uniref:HAD family hydrolase n=1 Tax=unclassified Methyloligella TaxID=2625955 RepID=UPI00157BCE70|nr:beta-phosphoglucomutase family hydrolase [Methyloligella sp. GL2]QKP78102.1 beta-phosphoglucomutase family hydrolase [Methyloligella sp. GL2]